MPLTEEITEATAAASPDGEARVKPEKTRYYFIDGLRGVAASLVMFGHFYGMGPATFHDRLASIFPALLDWLMGHGAVGVDIFFVISGFVITHSVGTARVTPRYFLNFALRRSLRLDPPYWVAIVFSLIVAEVSNRVLKSRAIPPPSWNELLANFTYLQYVFGCRSFVLVAWTLTHEIQFYILFIVLLGLAQAASPRDREYPSSLCLFVFFGLTGLASLLVPWDVPRHQMATCLKTWFLFCAGVFCYLIYQKRVGWLLGLAYLAPVSMVLLRHPSEESVTAVLTLVALLVAGATGNLERWLRWPVIQYMGRISYPLYLIHVPLGNRLLNLVSRYRPGSLAWALGWFLAACALSILAAELLHRLVEAPSMRLARRLKPTRPKREGEPRVAL